MGQFLAGCTEGWCNVTVLASGSVQAASVSIEGAIRSSLGKACVSSAFLLAFSRPLCCFAQTLLVRGKLEQRETVMLEVWNAWGERSGWGVVVVFSCMQPDPKTQVQVPWSPLSIPHPNPSSQLQSVCPLDPPLNPDYYGFVFFKLVICKDKRLIKVIWQGLFAANQWD